MKKTTLLSTESSIGKREKRWKPFFPGFRFLESTDKGERQRKSQPRERIFNDHQQVWLINVLEGNLSGISPPLLDGGGMGTKT